MDSVYGKLYDIVENRLREYDKTMPSSKSVFLYAVDKEPGILDGTQTKEMKDDIFFEVAYMGLLNRLPDESAKEAWKYQMQTEPENFRAQLLDALIFSQEAIIKGSIFKNNQIVAVKQRDLRVVQISGVKQDISGDTIQKRGLKDRLYALYTKLPLSMRIFLRKILRRG